MNTVEFKARCDQAFGDPLSATDRVILSEHYGRSQSYGDVPDEWLSVVSPGHSLRAEAIARVWSLRADVAWEAICAAHGHCCLYCNARAKLSMDHVVPRRRAGSDESQNIAPACLRCNSSKNATSLRAWLAPKSLGERWRIALRWMSARPDLPVPEGVLP